MKPSRHTKGLKDLVVGEPAMHAALDGEAAREQADALARQIAADPRLAAVVEKAGGRVEEPADGAGVPGDTIPAHAPMATVQIDHPRSAEPLVEHRSSQPAPIQPSLPADVRATAPCLDATVRPHTPSIATGRIAPGDGAGSGELAGVVQGPASRDGEKAAAKSTSLQTVLAATALVVGLLLVAWIAVGGGSTAVETRQPETTTAAAPPEPEPEPEPSAASPQVTATPQVTAAPTQAPVVEPPAAPTVDGRKPTATPSPNVRPPRPSKTAAATSAPSRPTPSVERAY